MTGMDLLGLEDNAQSPVVSVTQPIRRAADPDALDFRAPAGLKGLIEIQTDADIDIDWQHGESGVAGIVEAPGLYADMAYGGAMLGENLCGIVGGSGIGDKDQVGIPGRLAETGRKCRLIQADGINGNFHVETPGDT